MAFSAPSRSAGPAPLERGRSARIPPHSEEAEQGVIGAMLLDADRVVDLCLARRLTPECFYLQAHQALFNAMIDMNQNFQEIDLLTVTQHLRDRGLLDVLGGPAVLEQLVDATPTAAHAEFYINIVYQKYVLRSLVQRATDAIEACYEGDVDADEVLSAAEQSFFDIADLQVDADQTWPQLVKSSMEKIEQVFLTRQGLTGLASGFKNIDHKLLGFKPGEMVIIAARPSMGKTSLAMNIVEKIATGYLNCQGYGDKEGAAVAVFSLEMSAEQLVDRMICSRAQVSSHGLSSGNINRVYHNRMADAAADLMNADVYLDDTPGLTALELRARARRMKRKHGVGLVVIDYLQLLNYPQFAREGRQRETAAISASLKSMAKELKVPVVVLSQLSRAPETRDRLAVPKLSDLRDSGSIEQDADVVMLLRRPSKYPDDAEADDLTLAVIDVAKHRNGPTGEVRLNFEDEFTRFSDRARDDFGVDDMEAPMGGGFAE